MNLQNISIENFKCFKTQTSIEFGKLTLLTGANSSGKSSIIYSILGSLQSGEFPFKFSTNGKYVNMGDFKEIVHDHNRNEKIKINFNFKNDSIFNIKTTWEEDLNNNLPKLVELDASSDYFTLLATLKSKKYHVDFKYDPDKDPQNTVFTKEMYRKILSSFNDIIDNSEKDPKKIKKNTKNTALMKSPLSLLKPI